MSTLNLKALRVSVVGTMQLLEKLSNLGGQLLFLYFFMTSVDICNLLEEASTSFIINLLHSLFYHISKAPKVFSYACNRVPLILGIPCMEVLVCPSVILLAEPTLKWKSVINVISHAHRLLYNPSIWNIVCSTSGQRYLVKTNNFYNHYHALTLKTSAKWIEHREETE